MTNAPPATWIQELLQRSYVARGKYLTSYAQCEFLLADISVRLDDRFRYILDKRINAAKAMADSKGPLNAYADEFLPILDGFNIWRDRRHWFAHGLLMFTSDKQGRHLFELRRYEPEGNSYKLRTWMATIEDLENAAAAINVYCIAFVDLHKRIYLELGLEET